MEEKSDSVVCVRLSFGPTLRSCPASPTGPDCIPANRGPGQQPPEDSVHGSVHFDDPPTNADERGIPAFVSIHHGTHSAGADGDPNSRHCCILEEHIAADPCPVDCHAALRSDQHWNKERT